MKLVFVRVLLVGLLSAFAAPSALSIGADAFNLAVQHFDPAHEVGLDSNGPEARFMLAALSFAREQVPETRSIYNRDASSRSTIDAPGVANCLQLVELANTTGEKTLTTEKRAAISGRIAAGCLADRRLDEKSFSSGRTRARRSTYWQLRTECEGRTDIDFCENRAVVEWLCASGVDGILLTESIYPKNSWSELYIRFNSFVDLEYKAGLLQNDPRYDSVFESYSLKPYVGLLYGDGNSVELVAALGYEGFDGVVIEFKIGWGDCPAGCIYDHYWKVFIRAEGESDGQGWQFVIADVEEGGTPIREGARARLRGSVTR